jgi:hypothetical protein
VVTLIRLELAADIDWLAAQVARQEGVELKVEGATGREKAAALVTAMLEAGLAVKV